MAPPLRIGLIGCGGISEAHLRGYAELRLRGVEAFDVVAVCDLVEEKARRAASVVGGFQGSKPAVYTSYEEMVASEDLDAVDICTDHRSHHVIASFCLSSGLDVIIEKPLAVTMRAAKLILDAARRHGRILAVAENYRRRPENRAARWCIERGLIGEPRMVVWYCAGWSGQAPGWRGDKLAAGGSWLFDGGVHLADLDRYHLDREAEEVYGVVKLYEPVRGGQRLTVDDSAMAIIKYGDVLAQWLWTAAARGRRLWARVVYGSKGCVDHEGLHVQVEDDRIVSTPMRALVRRMMSSLSDEERERMFPRGITDTFATELYDFYLAVIERRRPEVDGEEAYRDMAIPLAIYESSALGRPVKVKDVEELRVEEYQKEINESLGL
ncbi:MAG: hypothetical protein DRJ56_02810 [Thermoprotei archaeon]|nr:MAG: hypothetical protein DRJ56_02810 [Thermoprotei archaeon]